MIKKKEIHIIGAGIAGLTIGCYLQMNGFNTQIFESHSIAGGLCTAWKRKGYTFDGCIHSTIASGDRYKLNKWFGEIINFDTIKYHFYNELSLIQFEDGKTFHFYTNPDKLENELIALAPEDETFIKKMIQSIKVFAKHDLQMSKPIELWSPLDYYLRQFITLPYISHLSKWSKSLKETISKCKSPLLRSVLNQDFFTRYPFYFFLISLGQMNNNSVGYPIGGSLQFANTIEETYKNCGGTIHYNSKVEKIIVNNHRASGIVLEDGKKMENADYVISAADGFETIYSMLDGKYIDKKITQRYESHSKWPSVVLVSLGVNRSFATEPSLVDIRLNSEFIIDEQTKTDTLPVTIYNFDSTLAPEGKTCIRVIFHTHNYKYWDDLKKNNPVLYTKEKNRIAENCIEILDKRLGNIKNYVEVIDVATPATFKRYTKNWNGSIQGWEWMSGLIPEHFKNNLKGLQNFYMTGQWTMPGGGIAGAFLNARDLARIICKKNRVAFKGRR